MPANHIWRITPTAAGFIKSQYPDGNDAAAPPTWATVPNFMQKSSTFSVDVSQYLAGSYTSITFAVVTGTQAGSGWSFSGTTLTYSGTGSGVLTVRLTAINGATQAKSNVFSIESVVLLAADTYAPAIVSGLTTTINASNKPVISWKPTSDPAPSGVTWSGLLDYQLYRDGVLLNTQGAAQGLQFSLTTTTLGTPAIGGSGGQSGATVSLAAGGTQYFNTADQGTFLYSQITGDFFAYGKVSTLTSTYSGSKLLIDARSTTDQGSTRVSAVAYAGGVNLEFRGAAGSSASQGTLIATTLPIWIALGRAGNVWTVYYSSTGNNWITHSTVTIVLPTQLSLGIGAGACQADTIVSGVIDQFSVSQASDLSYTDTSAVDGTSYAYLVKARDIALNVSTSGIVAATTAPAITNVAARYNFLGWSGLSFVNRAFSGTNGYADITGRDGVTGYLEPPEGVVTTYPGGTGLWGGRAQLKTSIQCIGGNPLTDQTRSIITGTLHDGTTGSFYRNSLVTPYQGPSVGGTQNDYIIWPDPVGQGMCYIRQWVRLGDTFQSAMQNGTSDGNPVGNGAFFVFSQTKTQHVSARVQLSATRQNSSLFADTSRSYFQLTLDWASTAQGTYGAPYKVWVFGPNPINNIGKVGPAIPTGQWFLVEFAYRQTYTNAGWVWFAINGAEVWRYLGPTMDPAIPNVSSEVINRLFPTMTYTNLLRPFNYDVGSLEVWTTWPSDATSHPSVS